MKIKLDENLPVQIKTGLTAFGHDVHTTYEEKLTGSKDAEIWAAAQNEQRLLITQDLDFADVRQFIPGTHHGILLVRLHFPSRMNLINRILQLFVTENVTTWTGCFIVATERKVRVRREPLT
jgi:predicted nuclease of predicted toxin-antitoxin system